jgi:hypothetical protein
MKNNIAIACSPVSGRIYAGVPMKPGLFGKNKQDVTDICIYAVTEYVKNTGSLLVAINGEKFVLSVSPREKKEKNEN